MHGPSDILQLSFAHVEELMSDLATHVLIGRCRDNDTSRLSDTLQPRGNVDAVAHQVTVALLNDVAEMNSYPKIDTAVLWQAGVTLDHALLHFDRATHGVHHAAELDEGAVTGSLYDPPLIGGDGGIDEIAAQPSKTGKGANLVG